MVGTDTVYIQSKHKDSVVLLSNETIFACTEGDSTIFMFRLYKDTASMYYLCYLFLL